MPGLTRPLNTTPWRALALAGDWTDTGYPGVLEGAVMSGLAAARTLNRARVDCASVACMPPDPAAVRSEGERETPAPTNSAEQRRRRQPCPVSSSEPAKLMPA